MSHHPGASKAANNGQSRRTFLDKLKPKACRKQKKHVKLMVPGTQIPYPPPAPPKNVNHFIPHPGPPPPPRDSAPPPPSQGPVQYFNPGQNAGPYYNGYNYAPAVPQNTQLTGQASYQHPVDITIGAGNNGVPGYIRIQGGADHRTFNNYDAHIPLAELINAGPAQRSAILSTLSMGHLGNTQAGHGGNSGNSGRLADGRFAPDTNYHGYYPKTIAMPPHRSPSPTKTHASHAPSHHSKAGSHRSHHTHHTKAPNVDRWIKSIEPPTINPNKDSDLSCCVCHARKDPHSHNVKRLASLGDTAICWRCIHSQIGVDAGLHWFRD